MVFICGQRKPKVNAQRDFFFSNGYVNYLTSVIGKLSQTNLPLSLCFSCREVKSHFSRFWSEKLRRQSLPLMELWDSQVPYSDPYWSLPEHLLGATQGCLRPGCSKICPVGQHISWAQSSKEKGSTTVPKCSAPARKLSLPWKIPMSPEAADHKEWAVGSKMRFYF